MNLLEGVKRNVIVLGVVSFLTDVSSEMIFPILPVFLTTVLGVSTAIVGLIEGIADSTTSLLDIFVGYASDRAGERKKFVLAGYGLSSVTKAGIALANAWPQFLVLRGIERVGKSIRDSPRDAIIASSSTPAFRGKVFGLHRAMDSLGAIVGPIIAYLVLLALGSTESGYRAVFLAALVPAFAAVAVVWLVVREPKTKGAVRAATAPRTSKNKPGFWDSLRALSPRYRRFLGASAIFSLAYFSFALLIVRASQAGIATENILLMYVLYNVFYALASVPAGRLSDMVGRRPVIVASFFLYALVLLGFGFAAEFWQFALLFAVYGVFVAADESVNKAYVSDISGEAGRATALGAYNTTLGAVYLPANAVFGVLWAVAGNVPAFTAAAIVAALGGVAMLVYAK